MKLFAVVAFVFKKWDYSFATFQVQACSGDEALNEKSDVQVVKQDFTTR